MINKEGTVVEGPGIHYISQYEKTQTTVPTITKGDK